MSSDVMIGEILVKAQIITTKQLDECVRLSGMKRQHLGQMLIMAGYINSRDLQVAVDAQAALRDNHVDFDTAVKIIRIACKQSVTFQDVLRNQQAAEQQEEARIGWTLGQLLHEADIADQNQLDVAHQRSNSTGIPTGRILVLNGVLTDELLSRALDLLVKVRDEVCSREDAIEAMQVAAGFSQGSPITQNLLLPPATKRPRLGQLMLMAGIMNDKDVMNAVELGLTHGILIGQVMVEQGYVSVNLVEAALELQSFIETGQVDIERAGEVLQRVYHGGGSVQDLITSLQPIIKMNEERGPKISFEKLLVLSRVVSQEQIHEAFDICRQTPEALAKILCLTGFMEGRIHNAVLRCHELLDQGRITQDDALVALDYCFNKDPESSPDFDEALSELGWSDISNSSAGGYQDSGQEFDPERTADEIPIITASEMLTAAAEPASSGFNLLEHFGLSSDSQENTAEDSAAAPDEEPPTPEVVATRAEREYQDAGDEPMSMGVETSDTPVFSLTERVVDNPMDDVPRGQLSSGRLAGILDRLVDEDTDAPNGGSKGNGQGAPEAKPSPPVEPESQPARPLGPLGRVRPDKDSLRQQEMTIAPQRLKIDDASLLAARAQSEEALPPEPEAEKKAAVGAAMYRLAESYFEQGDFTEAQKIYEKILAIRQAELGSQHVELVDDLNKLAEVLWVQGNFRQAEPFVRRAVTILESTQPCDSLKLAEGLRILAGLFFQQGKFEPSIPFLEHALLLKRQALGEEHRDVGNLLKEYAKLLKKMGRTAEAEKHYLQAKKILSKE